jgi:predicted outer membrane lipoprotein
MSILDPAAGPTLGLALAIAFAVLLAGWLRERRVGQTASWRKVALAVVAGSLLILIIQPSTQRTVDRQTAWVLTPGATREAAEDKGLVLDESILSVALTGTEPWSSSTAKAPDLATFLRSRCWEGDWSLGM